MLHASSMQHGKNHGQEEPPSSTRKPGKVTVDHGTHPVLNHSFSIGSHACNLLRKQKASLVSLGKWSQLEAEAKWTQQMMEGQIRTSSINQQQPMELLVSINQQQPMELLVGGLVIAGEEQLEKSGPQQQQQQHQNASDPSALKRHQKSRKSTSNGIQQQQMDGKDSSRSRSG